MKKKEKFRIFSSIKLLWHFMGLKEKITFVCIFLFSIVTALTYTYAPMIPALIISKLTGEQFLIFGFIDLSFLDTVPYFIVVCTIPIVLWLFGMLHYRMIDVFARKMMCIVNEKAQEIILLKRKNLDFGMTTGETDYIIKSAVDNIYNLIEPFCWNLSSHLLSIIFMTIQIFSISIIAGVLEIVLILLILTCVLVRTKVQKGVVENIEAKNAKISNHFLMSLTNLPMIMMLRSKHKEMKELRKLNGDFYKENVKRANIGFWYWVIITAVEYIGLAGIIVAFYYTSTTTALLASIATLIGMINDIWGMVEDWGYIISDLQSSAIKLGNLRKIYPDQTIIFKPKDKKKANKLIKTHINELQVVNYKVKVNGFEKEYNQTFKSGKVYVICGQSGKGKTTLISAICGIRETEKGYLLINGKQKLKNMYGNRDKISYLFQDSLLFDRSLTENIAYPDETLNEKAQELVKTFKIDKILARETNETLSTTLSGGEKKRIDIIRTISKDRDIYLFDEPTNELDNENVKRAIKEIKKLAKQNKIVIIISHDERCVEIADEIVQL